MALTGTLGNAIPLRPRQSIGRTSFSRRVTDDIDIDFVKRELSGECLEGIELVSVVGVVFRCRGVATRWNESRRSEWMEVVYGCEFRAFASGLGATAAGDVVGHFYLVSVRPEAGLSLLASSCVALPYGLRFW